MAATITSHEETITPHDEKFNHKRKITKFALAGIAVVGVGAALTSAAWSDSVFFSAPAKAATFELEGQDPVTGVWTPADTAGAAIVLPADAIDAVGPNSSDSYTVKVRNAGNVNITLAPATATTTGTLFQGANRAVVTFGGYSDAGNDGILLPNEEATVAVIVTGGNWTGTQYQGTTGTVTVQIQGQS